jgi:hypothetical protein
MPDKKAAPTDAPIARGTPVAPGSDVLHTFTDPVKPEHGAQVVLEGRARAAARGGLHGDIVSNTIARDAEVAAGRAADGLTPDGSTPDGRLPADVATGAEQPRFGPPGEGEGKPGSRPGAETVAEAEAAAAAERAKAREAAAKAAAAPAPAPAPAAKA